MVEVPRAFLNGGVLEVVDVVVQEPDLLHRREECLHFPPLDGVRAGYDKHLELLDVEVVLLHLALAEIFRRHEPVMLLQGIARPKRVCS
jgi:hypothetical protein